MYWWMAAALAAEPDALDTLVDLGRVLLDDRIEDEERVAAARALADTGDVRALWLLRAGAGTRTPVVQAACAEAALTFDDPEAVGVAERVLIDVYAPRETRLQVVDALGDDGTSDAARVLWELVANRDVPARVRGAARSTLEERYPDELATLGAPHSVVDPIGGLAFVTANGVAGGILLSSVGVWGQFDGAPAIGAVGGGAIGLGSGTLYASSTPLAGGQGLAYASGVSWGLTYGLWTTTVAHSRWRYVTDSERVSDLSAAYRAVGVGVGASIGALAMGREPAAWDVLEVDTAGYLGSAIALAGTGLAFYRPPPDRDPAYTDYRRQSAQWLEASSMIGGAVGLGAGLVLVDRWELDERDAAFALTAGLEAAWIGTFLPGALGIDDSELKGTIRLPWHVAVAGGLALSEVSPVSPQRTAMTGLGGLIGNQLGAGIPLVLGYDDERTVDAVMVPVGAAATVGGYALTDLVDPRDGDWAMLAVGTAIGTGEAYAIGAAIDDLDVWVDPDQVSGFGLIGTSVTMAGMLALAPVVDPRPDSMVVLGTAATWGAAYGSLVPVALRLDPSAAGVLLPGAITAAAATGGVGVALLPEVGLRPGQTVVPQLAGLAGGTSGALIAALVSTQGEDVALGSLIGASLGIGTGVVIVATRPAAADLRPPGLAKLPGHWMPTVGTWEGADGTAVPTLGVTGSGW